jgi:glutamine amidotransferase-like uncharacterized protein
MKKVYLYIGTGAYQAKDIENLFAVKDVAYFRICEHDLSKPNKQDIFIVPGGAVSQYLGVFGKKGVEAIKSFVKNGGTYVGICAGAYIAGKSYQNKPGLNFFDAELKYQKSAAKIVSVFDKKGKKFDLINENGPDLSVVSGGDTLLKDKSNKPYAISIKYGKGKAILFSAHPEGSVYYKKDPRKFSGAKFFLKLLN